MQHPYHAIGGLIWKYIAEKSRTSATNVTMHPLRQAIWWHIWKQNKCNQCDFASAQAGNLRRHLTMHSGEKSNKCNHCNYVSSQAGHLRAHLKTHSGEKSNKCNQCDYASSYTHDLRTHLKTHTREKSNKCHMIIALPDTSVVHYNWFSWLYCIIFMPSNLNIFIFKSIKVFS